MRLFVFGLGYTAQRFVEMFVDELDDVAGTVRHAHKRDQPTQKGVRTYLFDAVDQDPGIGARIREADVLLVSVPPGRSDEPVLSARRSKCGTEGHLSFDGGGSTAITPAPGSMKAAPRCCRSIGRRRD